MKLKHKKSKMRMKRIPKQKSVRNIARKRRAEVIKTFTRKVMEKFGKYIKCIVLVGSVARDEFKPHSDIDIFLVIDDTRSKITPEAKEKFDNEIDEIAESVSKDIVVQPAYLLTEFWEMVRTCHPLIYNFVRDGIPVYDTGLFLPVKRLLEMGRIPATKEAIDALMEKAPKRMRRVKDVKLFMVAEDCYYAMVDTTQAILMSLGFSPPAPGRAAEEFRKHLVDAGLVDEKYAKWLDEINEFRKKVEHKQLKEISGAEIDEWIKKTDEFVEAMQKLTASLELKKKERIVEKSHDVMTKAVVAALKSVKKTPSTQEEVRTTFKKYLVDTGLVSNQYLDVFDRLEGMRDKVLKGKITEIPDKEIYSHREYVRKFIHHVGKMLKDRDVEVGESAEMEEKIERKEKKEEKKEK